MNHPQLVILERDGRLAQMLRATAEKQRWSLREPRQRETCLELLASDTPTVFVLHVGNKLEKELGILERLHGRGRTLRIVAVGDIANDPLAELVWDLGASFVLFPPQSRDLLPGVVLGLMTSTIGREPTREELAVAELQRETAALPPVRPGKRKKERGP